VTKVVIGTASKDWSNFSAEMELKRIEDAKRCLKLIDPSMKASIGDIKLIACYEEVVKASISDCALLIQKLAPVGDQERSDLGDIFRLCARIWLECCSQRYRVLVSLPPSSGNVLASTVRNPHLVCLVSSPDLKRFGTLSGEDMAVGAPVAGWRSAVEVYPPQ
jgi:hypothetical protein